MGSNDEGLVKVTYDREFLLKHQTKRHCPKHGAVLYNIKKDGKTLWCPICGDVELVVITKPMSSKLGDLYQCWNCGKEYYPTAGTGCPFCGESTQRKKNR